jgi:hypothetical protein
VNGCHRRSNRWGGKTYSLASLDTTALALDDNLLANPRNDRICARCYVAHRSRQGFGRSSIQPSSSLPKEHSLGLLAMAAAASSLPPPPPPPPPVLPAPAVPYPSPPPSNDALWLQCLFCLNAPLNVVWLPCLHQRCCSPCWAKVEREDRRIFKIHRRLKHELSTGAEAAQRRPSFKPRCPVCREPVDGVHTTRMD